MFQTRTKQILATLSICALSALPIQAHANETEASVIGAQAAAEHSIQDVKADLLQIQHDTKVKVAATQDWVKDQTAHLEVGNFIDDVETATDRLQERVSPAGHALKTSLKTKLPGASLLGFADRTFTVFGLMLMMSFALAVFLLSLSRPMSRTGGRH